ncbi:histidine kinase osmosensor [Actinomortierella wolfii]|nr:histidine kinase osmosensor [Actinomortierella wolfii]
MRPGRAQAAAKPAFTFDIARFLDFAFEASSLVEALHHHGFVHGQLCPSSFAWELDTGADDYNSSTPHSPEHRRYESHSSAMSSYPSFDQDTWAALPRAKTVHPLLPTPPIASSNPSHPWSTRASNAKTKSYTLTLDCSHLGLSKEFFQSPGSQGLRPSPPSLSPPSAFTTAAPPETTLSQPMPSTIAGSPSGPTTAHTLHDAFVSRVTRLTKSLISSPNGPPLLPQFLNHVGGGSGGQSALAGTSAPSSNSTSESVVPTAFAGNHTQQKLNKHFLLYMPRELYVTPGCTLPAQVDIHSLGVLFYYLLTAHTTLTPLDFERDPSTAALMNDLKTFTIGYGSTSANLGAFLPTTTTRLANIIQRMVSKVPSERYVSIVQVRKEIASIRDQERGAAKLVQLQQQEDEQQQQHQQQQQQNHGWSEGSNIKCSSPSYCVDQQMPVVTPIPLSLSTTPRESHGDMSAEQSNRPTVLTTAPIPVTRVSSPFDDSPTDPAPVSHPNSFLPQVPDSAVTFATPVPIQAHITPPPKAASEVQTAPEDQMSQVPRLTKITALPRPISPAVGMPLSPVSSTRDSIDSDQAISSSLNMSMTMGMTASRLSISSGNSGSTYSDDLSPEDRLFVCESVLALGHILDLSGMLQGISQALDNILSGHPPEEMAIVLWQKDDTLSAGGSWAIVEDKPLPGNKESTLTWTSLSNRRDLMPVLVRKSLDSREPIFSTAVGCKSQLPTIACIPILSMTGGDNTSTTLVGALFLHHIHPKFYFSKRDRELLVMFCQRIGTLLLNCDQIAAMDRQLTHAMNRIKFLEDLDARNQKNEHEITAMMEALPFFIWTAERDDVVSRRYLSRSWFDWTGLPGENKTSDKWLSVMHPEDLAGFQKETAQCYKTGSCKDCEFRLMRYDGVYRWHISRAVPILNHKGEILMWIGVTMDIDELYLAQKAELRKKSNFLANMSHELRTPFSGFHGMLTLLGYTSLTEEQQECVYTAKTSCEKLLLIIDDLLDFSKLEAEKVILESAPFDLEDVFSEVESIVKPLADQKGLDLVFVVDDNVPPILIGDANRLKQILLNLAGNAIKFTHEGHIAVKCRMLDRDADDSYDIAESGAGTMIDCDKDDNKFYFRHEQNGAGQCQSEKRAPNSGRFSSPEPLSEKSIRLIFFVEDTGIGIGQDAQETLFSPFSQVDGSATRHYGGSGLGLSICLQLVKLMKGRIGLDSTPGKGSTFWFVVQCEEGDTTNITDASGRLLPMEEVRDSNREMKRITRALGAPTILIASASEQTVNTLVGYLSSTNTEIVNTPQEAANRLLEKKEFDFVCWDFPKDDPLHEVMLSLHARPELVSVNFVLLYTPIPNADSVRRTQSLQIQSSGGSLASEARRRPVLSQSISLRMESSSNLMGSNSNNNSGNTGNSTTTFAQQEGGVPGLDPIHLKSRRIFCISKPIRRLKLLKAFVEILEGSSRIQGAAAGSSNKSAVSSAGNASGGGSADKLLQPRVGGMTTSGPPGKSMTSMAVVTSGAFVTSQTGALSSLLPPSTLSPHGLSSVACPSPIAPKGPVVTPFPEYSNRAQSTSSSEALNTTMHQVHLPTPPEKEATACQTSPLSVTGQDVSSSSTIQAHPVTSVDSGEEGSTISASTTQNEEELQHQDQSQRPTPTPSPPPPSSPASSPSSSESTSTTSEVSTGGRMSKQESGKEGTKPSKLSTVRMSSRGRSNSPKPARQPMLVSDEKSDVSLSKEEAESIAGMHVLLAEDNFVAQRVLSKQLSMFGLKVACANDGAEAITLFKSHPRGHFKLGFFDHHMPNCDGVQATQQIRALEREHAIEMKGPVPRLPLVAVTADIQEVAMKACLNSGMERYVTKPLMQRDLVAMVRHYLVEGDPTASIQQYTPPQHDSIANAVATKQQNSNGLATTMIPSTAEAMVSTGLSMAGDPLHSGSGGPNFLSPTTANAASLITSPPPAATKKEVELSEAALRGLALIRECSLNDEASKVGGGGTGSSSNNMLLKKPIPTSSSMISLLSDSSSSGPSTLAPSGTLSTNQMGGQSVVSNGRVISKSVSTSSLSVAFRSGSSLSSNSTHNSPKTPNTSTFPSLNTSPTPTSGGGGSHHIQCPSGDGLRAVAAMAAAAVSSVSTAIERHLPTPSIHATASSRQPAVPHYQQQQQQQQKQQQAYSTLPLPASLTTPSASSSFGYSHQRAGGNSPASSSQSAQDML